MDPAVAGLIGAAIGAVGASFAPFATGIADRKARRASALRDQARAAYVAYLGAVDKLRTATAAGQMLATLGANRQVEAVTAELESWGGLRFARAQLDMYAPASVVARADLLEVALHKARQPFESGVRQQDELDRAGAEAALDGARVGLIAAMRKHLDIPQVAK